MSQKRRRLRSVPHGGSRAVTLRAYAATEVRENDDGTFDLVGVEILSTGGPVHGVGSPPEGDFWTLAELEAMAVADRELGDELKPANKIGHPDEQILVKNSIAAGELPEPESGEMPAVGWLEDLRVVGERLLADVRQVPKLVKDLIQLGAYRTRSVELSKVTSQETGKTYDWVVTGMAWLGGKQPAVKTLGDVVALYEGDVPIRRVFVDRRDYAVGDVIWKPARSLQAIRSALQEALNGPTAFGYVEPRWYVRDVSLDSTAIIEDWTSSDGDAYLMTFAFGDNGKPVPAQFDEWTPAEPTWIEKAKDYAASSSEYAFLTLRERRSDTGAKMRYSAEQIRKFATAIGKKPEDVTAKMLEDAGVAPVEEPVVEEQKPVVEEPKPDEKPVEDAATRENAALAARVVALEAENKQERRRSFVDAAVRDRKIAPGQRESLETYFDRDEDGARKFVDELPKRDDLDGELGMDDDDERDLEASGGRSYEETASARLGIAKDDLV